MFCCDHWQSMWSQNSVRLALCHTVSEIIAFYVFKFFKNFIIFRNVPKSDLKVLNFNRFAQSPTVSDESNFGIFEMWKMFCCEHQIYMGSPNIVRFALSFTIAKICANLCFLKNLQITNRPTPFNPTFEWCSPG